MGRGYWNGATQARRPQQLHLCRYLLAEWQAAGVGIERRDGQAVGQRRGAVLETPESHTGWVYAIAFSPDGKQLASASSPVVVRNHWSGAAHARGPHAHGYGSSPLAGR